MHFIAAVGDAHEVARLALNGHASGREADSYCGVPCRDVLANPAPAQPCDDWLGLCLVAHGSAHASASDHLVLPRLSKLALPPSTALDDFRVCRLPRAERRGATSLITDPHSAPVKHSSAGGLICAQGEGWLCRPWLEDQK